MRKRLLRLFRRRPPTAEEEQARMEAKRLLEDKQTMRASQYGSGSSWIDPNSGRR